MPERIQGRITLHRNKKNSPTLLLSFHSVSYSHKTHVPIIYNLFDAARKVKPFLNVFYRQLFLLVLYCNKSYFIDITTYDDRVVLFLIFKISTNSSWYLLRFESLWKRISYQYHHALQTGNWLIYLLPLLKIWIFMTTGYRTRPTSPARPTNILAK